MPADPDNMDWNLNVIVRGTIITVFILALGWVCFSLVKIIRATVPPQTEWRTKGTISIKPNATIDLGALSAQGSNYLAKPSAK